MRRAGWVVGLALAGAVVAGTGRSEAQERRNVIVVMTDDQDAASLEYDASSGKVRPMRKLMAGPEGSWVRFTRFFANASICCPARSTGITGQSSTHTGVLGNSYGDRLDDAHTLATWLDAAGYTTAHQGKYLNGYPWRRGSGYVPPGWDEFRVPTGSTDSRTSLATDFIRRAPQPFFLWVSYLAPHNPAARKVPARYTDADVYLPPSPPNVNEADVSDKPAWVRGLPLLSQTQLDAQRREHLAAQRSLLAVDDGVQAIVDALKARGALENTVVIYASDNGFSFGSHRHVGKFCVYEECSKIPLLVRWPGAGGNRTETGMASNLDLAPTIAQAAGVAPDIPQDGRSLVPLLSGTASSWSQQVLLERRIGANRRFFGIRVPGWTYAEYDNGDRELYDLSADPWQLNNLAGRADHAGKEAALAAQLDALRG